MIRRLRTVKSQIILLMVLFAMLVTALISALSYYLIYTFHSRTTVQSTEFNLQLVANLIEQDLKDLTALAVWCGNSSQISDYFNAPYEDFRAYSTRAYNRLYEEYTNNRAKNYVHRLIVVDDEVKRVLQVGNFANYSQPVNIYNVGRIKEAEPESEAEWHSIAFDPFYIHEMPVIPFFCPVYDPQYNIRIGTVYLSASTAIITDKLKGYNLAGDSSLILNLRNSHFLIESGSFTPVRPVYEIISEGNPGYTGSSTSVANARLPGGEKRTLVSYPVRSGISITQVLSNKQFVPQKDAWTGLLAGICVLILSLALIVTYLLDRSISRPIARLHKKIDLIAEGNFSRDESLESDSELGMMGKGINRLSRDVVALMNNRLAAEKHKRDLEYRMLQSQINPHFLYNTLNSIKWMATIQGANGIAEVIIALSRLLEMVAKDIRKVVPIKEELDLLDDYLLIQNYRYCGNITLTKRIENESLLNVPIPRFTLQPIVENAIFHGIEPKGKGHILLKIECRDENVLVSVTDDGIGMSSLTIRKVLDARADKDSMFSKLGMRSVDERLRYAFGKEYGLFVQSEEGRYTTITIRLPLYGGAAPGGCAEMDSGIPAVGGGGREQVD